MDLRAAINHQACIQKWNERASVELVGTKQRRAYLVQAPGLPQRELIAIMRLLLSGLQPYDLLPAMIEKEMHMPSFGARCGP
jgi:hypothetical protein